MEASRLISFSSPVRPHLSKEETTDPETGPPDEELRFDKEEELQPDVIPPAPTPHASPADKVSPPKDSSKLRKGRMHPQSKARNGTDSGERPHPTLLPMVFFLSVTCLVVTVATTVSHIVLGSIIGAAIILVVTCPIMGWGMLSLILRKPSLIGVYGVLLVFESIALIVVGGLEANELKSQLDLVNDISSNLPALPPSTGSQMLEEARRKMKVLGAFTGLFFACALVFIVTAILDFHLYGEISLERRVRLHDKNKEKEEQSEKIEKEKKKEGAIRIPEHRAPSPDLLDEEELLDVDVTGGGASPQAVALNKEADVV